MSTATADIPHCLEVIIDEDAGYIARKFINQDGYLFDRDHCMEDIGRPAWAVHRLGLSDAEARKNTMFFRTHKSVNAFFRRIRQNRSQS